MDDPINRLPDGYEIRISMENSGRSLLLNFGDSTIHVAIFDDLAKAIVDAVEVAIKHDAKRRGKEHRQCDSRKCDS